MVMRVLLLFWPMLTVGAIEVIWLTLVTPALARSSAVATVIAIGVRCSVLARRSAVTVISDRPPSGASADDSFEAVWATPAVADSEPNTIPKTKPLALILHPCLFSWKDTDPVGSSCSALW